MKNFYKALFVFILFSHQIADAKSLRLHNLAIQFLQFWEHVKAKPVDEQVSVFKKEIVPTFPAFYQYKFAQWKKEHHDLDTELKKQLLDFPKIASRFSQLSLSFSESINRSAKIFIKTFPKFDPNIDVYIIYGLTDRDGGIEKLDGKLTLFFGLDTIARYNQDESNIPLFFHELFHSYHFQHFSRSNTLYSRLWTEGLATYVAHQLHPQASWEEILADSKMKPACEEKLLFLLKDLEKKLQSNDEATIDAYFRGDSFRPNIPTRAGYYLGYLIAKEMNQDLSLDKLAHLQSNVILTRIRIAIKNLQTTASENIGKKVPNQPS